MKLYKLNKSMKKKTFSLHNVTSYLDLLDPIVDEFY